MPRKLIVVLIGIIAVLGIIFFPSRKEDKWTGFYYPLAAKPGVVFSDIMNKPSVRSDLNALQSLEECDKWAMDICKKNTYRKPGDPGDVYYCATKCHRTWHGTIACDEKEGSVVSVCSLKLNSTEVKVERWRNQITTDEE